LEEEVMTSGKDTVGLIHYKFRNRRWRYCSPDGTVHYTIEVIDGFR
jgi:hypothetical protein